VGTALKRAAFDLETAGVDSPALSAQIILAHVLNSDRLQLVVHPHRVLTSQEKNLFDAQISRRVQGVPVAYLTGEKEFFGLNFLVNEHVLIPRPETEGIVEEVLNFFPDREQDFCFADLGTGSGALAVTICSLFPNSLGVATDTSLPALKTARENAKRHGVIEQIGFVRGDMGNVLAPGSLDLVVSNPPYISAGEFTSLSREVSAFEPQGALLAGKDGLRFYPAIARDAAGGLKNGGKILVEIGRDQGMEVHSIFRAFDRIRIIKDLAGWDRIVAAVSCE